MAVLTCLFCGEPERVELFEFWKSGEFMLDTCCEGMHEAVTHEMNEDPDYATWLLKECHVEDYADAKLRRVPAVDAQFLLDFNPELKPIEFREAAAFVDKYHEHNEAPRGWKFGRGIWNGPQLIGVVTVGRPVARAIDASTTLEVNRVCVSRRVPGPLRWNACSMAYGWAAREAEKKGFRKIITYTLESEPGTALRAAGWIPEHKTRRRPKGWNCKSRPRKETTPTEAKIRWAKYLNGSAPC